jgi:hypothetical protein
MTALAGPCSVAVPANVTRSESRVVDAQLHNGFGCRNDAELAVYADAGDKSRGAPPPTVLRVGSASLITPAAFVCPARIGHDVSNARASAGLDHS